jgi:hypothetical protein
MDGQDVQIAFLVSIDVTQRILVPNISGKHVTPFLFTLNFPICNRYVFPKRLFPAINLGCVTTQKSESLNYTEG